MSNSKIPLLVLLAGGILTGGCAPTPAQPSMTQTANSATGVVDVTAPIKSLIVGNALHAPASNELAGTDPAHKIVKRLVVIYNFGAQAMVASATEGETLELAAPAGRSLEIQKALYGDIQAPPDVTALLATTFPLAQPNASLAAIAQAKDIALPRPQLYLTLIGPSRFEKRGAVYFADFGRDSFGNLQLTLPRQIAPGTKITIRLGEKLSGDGSIDRAPGGSISFVETSIETRAHKISYQPDIASKGGYQNSADAIKVPADIGSITPFRYAEIEGSPLELSAENVSQQMVHAAFDDGASSFVSSDETLNAVWNLCKHTMKASTAFGVYIDGERERRPYEADAYINQLSHYAVDLNPEVARYSFEYLLAHPTWPTEWSFHMPMMAAQDYRATGDAALAARNWDALKAKLLLDKTRADGLLVAPAIVDWPQGERDNYNDGQNIGQQAGPQVNTVANAFFYHALREMQLLAGALHKTDDERAFKARADKLYDVFNATFFDAQSGLYRDGEGSNHASIHANMFPLAFGLVPADKKAKIADWVQNKGMAVSVYGAQYLLEALYQCGKADAALSLMTSHGERSWWNMMASGATLTTEAWDIKFKPNLTWNHAWGAAPANIIMRYLVGVTPLVPGYEKIQIAPRPGALTSFDARVPTAKGAVGVAFAQGKPWQIEVPAGANARVSLPLPEGAKSVTMDGKPAIFTRDNATLTLENVGPGRHVFALS